MHPRDDYSVDVRNATSQEIDATVSYGDYSFENHFGVGQKAKDVTVFEPIPEIAEVSWIAKDGQTYRVSVPVRKHLPKEFKNRNTIIFTILPSGGVKLTFDVGTGYQTREVDGTP